MLGMSETHEREIATGLSARDDVGSAEAHKVARFFTRLLDEALTLVGDKITFDLKTEDLFVGVWRGESELKSIKLKAVWGNPLRAWIEERILPWFPRDNKSGIAKFATKVGAQFVSAEARFGDRNHPGFSLQGLRPIVFNDLTQALHLAPAAQENLLRISEAERGIIVAAHPLENKLTESTALALALTKAVRVAGVSLSTERERITKLAASASLILPVCGSDGFDLLLKLKEQGHSFEAAEVVGVICSAQIEKVCVACARETPFDQTLVNQLPVVLQPKQEVRYMVGRGCDQCNHTGYHGVVGIQSLVHLDEKIREKLAKNDHRSALNLAYTAGLRALLQDGVTKAIKGMTTLEALFKVVRSIPDGYVKLIEQARPQGYTDDPIKVGDGFFEGAGEGPKADSITQATFFRGLGGGSSGDSDAPLFSVGAGRKVRARPLILIVEDDADQREILEMVFQTSSYDIVSASDGEIALEKLGKEIPDLVITDLMMPNMDGAEFVRKMKRHPRYAKIPVIVLTVLSDAEKECELLDIGADDYVEKTVQRKVLLKRVEKVLSR